MVEAVVEYDYTAQEVDELTLRKGDIISDVKTLPGGWWEGRLAGIRGMFPDNFVKIMSKTETSAKGSSNDVTLRPKGGRRCKVLYSYQPANEDELQLTVDDIIEVIAEVEDGWWKGSMRDMVGVFPSNFVTEISADEVKRPRPGSRDDATKLNDTKSSESECDRSTSVSSPDSSQLLDATFDSTPGVPSLPPKPVKEQCRALFAYDAANGDELTLREGDVVNVVSRDVQDKGWWRGELRGNVGLFPDNFVELLPTQQEEPPRKPERSGAATTKSPLVTTNRARDSITKPPAAKPDVPPVPGKKPLVSLTAKKPDRVAVVVPFGDAPDGAGPSRPSPAPLPSEFDSVERSAMLSHPTASRAKAPGRRLPSSAPPRDEAHGLTNGAAEGADEEPKKLWEKNKAPWMEELRKNQARKSADAPAAVTAARNGARPQSMYGDLSNLGAKPGTSPPGKAVTVPPTKFSRAPTVTKTTIEVGPDTSVGKRETGVRINNGSPDASAIKRDGVIDASVGKRDSMIDVTNKREGVTNASAVRRESMNDRESVSDASTRKRESVIERESMNGAADKTESVADLRALVLKLQASVQQQNEAFTQALLELTARLDEETSKRIQVEQQLNKLTDLVTQV